MPFSDGVFDPKDRVFKMGHGRLQREYVRHATSSDGIHWTSGARQGTNIVIAAHRDSWTTWTILNDRPGAALHRVVA
jgi:hypothetical protein